MVRIAIVLSVSLLTAGCETVAGLLGAGIGPVMERIDERQAVTETVAHPSGPTREAALAALRHMGFDVLELAQDDDGEVIRARGLEGEVRVLVRPVARHATRVSFEIVTGFLTRDAATAKALIAQTLRRLEHQPARLELSAGSSAITSRATR